MSSTGHSTDRSIGKIQSNCLRRKVAVWFSTFLPVSLHFSDWARPKILFTSFKGTGVFGCIIPVSDWLFSAPVDSVARDVAEEPAKAIGMRVHVGVCRKSGLYDKAHGWGLDDERREQLTLLRCVVFREPTEKLMLCSKEHLPGSVSLSLCKYVPETRIKSHIVISKPTSFKLKKL